MTFKFCITLAIASLVLLNSCNKAQTKIDNLEGDISYLEESKEPVTKEEWIDLGNKMYDLENDLKINKENYSNEQIREIRSLEGRLTSLLVKKSADGIIDSVLDFSNQLEGFLEGVKSND